MVLSINSDVYILKGGGGGCSQSLAATLHCNADGFEDMYYACRQDGKPQTFGEEAQISTLCRTELKLFRVAIGQIQSDRSEFFLIKYKVISIKV